MLPARSGRRLSGKNATPPFTAFSSMDASAYGQLTSSAALPCSNANREVPASVRVIDGSAPGAVATDLRICSALTVAARCAGVSVRVTLLPSSDSTWPPALSSRVLNHTTNTLALVGLHADPAGFACGVQPGGLVHHRGPGCRRLVHQIWPVPEQFGIGGDGCGVEPVPSRWRWPAARAACRCWRRPRHGRPGRPTAAAPSPLRRTPPSRSRPAPSRPTVRSLALSRRASCSRWSSEDRGRLKCWMVNRPPNWSVQRLATAVNVAASLAGV